MPSSLYNCRVMHLRLRPRRYGFTTGQYMFLLDLADLDTPGALPALVSRNRFNAFSFFDRDHLYRGHPNVRDNVITYLLENGISESPHSIHLLTNLRVLGYVFNPVSFYFCDRADGSPLCVVVEVHNTFGELKPFLLRPEDWSVDRFERTQPKRFYISPFSELDHALHIKLHPPTEQLALYVNGRRPSEPDAFFRSSLTGKRIPLTNRSLLAQSLRFPFLTLRIMAEIHWHALRLYLKGVPFHRKSDHPELQQGIVPKRSS
jgi:uncharacterized protein